MASFRAKLGFMRADRLVATLLVLQARGRVTASQLAEELEISERTARRDLESLSMAGVPVYSQPGRGGGWSLVGGARTDLSGLTASEARTLFLVAGPSSTATPDVKAALRKLVQALPETFRADAEAAANAVVLDPVGWDRNRVERPPQLDELERAVIDGVQVRLGYADRAGTASDRTVHPLGLAVKGTTWYLVANTDRGLRTFRVNRVQSVARTEQAVERPEGFDLEQTWAGIVTSLDEQRAPLRVRAVAERAALGWLRSSFGTRMIVRESARADGRFDVELRGHVVESVAAELAGFGNQVEVLEPPEVRARLARVGAELTARYGSR